MTVLKMKNTQQNLQRNRMFFPALKQNIYTKLSDWKLPAAWELDYTNRVLMKNITSNTAFLTLTQKSKRRFSTSSLLIVP